MARRQLLRIQNYKNEKPDRGNQYHDPNNGWQPAWSRLCPSGRFGGRLRAICRRSSGRRCFDRQRWLWGCLPRRLIPSGFLEWSRRRRTDDRCIRIRKSWFWCFFKAQRLDRFRRDRTNRGRGLCRRCLAWKRFRRRRDWFGCWFEPRRLDRRSYLPDQCFQRPADRGQLWQRDKKSDGNDNSRQGQHQLKHVFHHPIRTLLRRLPEIEKLDLHEATRRTSFRA